MQLSFHEGVGDHRTVIVDVSSRSLIGKDKFKICRLLARRLSSTNHACALRYISYVEKELSNRQLHQKLCDISAKLHANNNDITAREELNNIDRQTTEIQAAGEKQCRKLFMGKLPFSLPVSHWIHKKWAYKALARLATGKCRNPGNIRRQAKYAGITNIDLSWTECMDGVNTCTERIKSLALSARGLRKVHLRDRLINAEEAQDPIRIKSIRQIITKEAQRNTWRTIKRVVNEPRLGAITKVEKVTGDGTTDIQDLDGMAAEIQQVTEKRFELAASAPVMNSSLRTSVGFLADTTYALKLVSGGAEIPPDVHEPT